jgi:hypothetical protein
LAELLALTFTAQSAAMGIGIQLKLAVSGAISGAVSGEIK